MGHMIKWDQISEKRYKTGVDHGVLYLQKNGAYPKGVGWNGLTSVNKTPGGAEDNKLYADNILYMNLRSAETLGLTIECYMYPDEWSACNGEEEAANGIYVGQQGRSSFGFSYRTKIGNDTDGEDHGYEITLAYGCSSSPSEQTSQTINDSPDAATFSYEVSTIPVPVNVLKENGESYKPTASMVIDSTKTDKKKLADFEAILYGTEGEYAEIEESVSIEDDEKYYEFVNGSYVETEDTEFVDGKKYYRCMAEPVDGRLPLPDEVISFFRDNQ